MAVFFFGDPVPPPRAWLLGLSKNKAASASIVLRLLSLDDDAKIMPSFAGRMWPEEVVQAVLKHPRLSVRMAFVGYGGAPIDQRIRLLDDSDPKVRRALAYTAVELGLDLPEEAFERLVNDPDPEVRWDIASHRALPSRFRVAGAHDADPDIRAEACRRSWEELPVDCQERLLADPEPAIRAQAELADLADRPVPADLFDRIGGGYVGESIAESRALTRELAERLATHEEASWRRCVASNPWLPADLVRRLVDDPEPSVRIAVSTHPVLGEDERSAIEVDIDPVIRYRPPSWVRAEQSDQQLLRSLAASSNVLIRRGVACSENLPSDVVSLLANDEDFAVRLLLAEHCLQAPSELLLSMWAAWDGLSRHQLREHPNFPRQGLARFADDPDPRMRELVFFDDQAPAQLIHRLSHDDDPKVRWRALHDERLSSGRIVELLDDSNPNLHRGAAADPRLPPEILIDLLEDDKLAEPAATNPALPVDVMHQLLNRAGVE